MKQCIVLLAFLAACSGTGNEVATPERGAGVTTLGLGRTARPDEIAALNIDVRPDGVGLPAGGSTAATGSTVYAAQCASCHGAEGQGTPAGAPLVGRPPNDAFPFGAQNTPDNQKTVGSYWPYATTVYDYINRTMPFNRPGSLSPDQIYGVTAWILWKNGIIEENFRIDRASLPAVRMPARDRFVPDDRERYRKVR
jgi:S-disulfanyl-L-cysteine oxidoreductase SoxD